MRLNFSRTEISTAKPMVLGCVQHYSTHLIKKLGKSLEPFFHSQKNCQKCPKKDKNWAKNADFSRFCYPFIICGPFLLIFNKTPKLKIINVRKK